MSFFFYFFSADKTIEFEQDEESEEEAEAMEVEETPDAGSLLNNTTTTNSANASDAEKTEPISSTVPKDEESTSNQVESLQKQPTQQESIQALSQKPLNDNVIPGGPSTILSNKVISSIQQEAEEEDDQRSQTPKLDDISDVEDLNADNDDDDDNDVDSMNDPSKHPALAPHAQAHMTDDDLTDSTGATPQTTTEGNTPMPLLEDDVMEESSNQPHPLSQEILRGATSFLQNNNEESRSLNNDSPAIQTPEDNIIHQQPAEAMDE